MPNTRSPRKGTMQFWPRVRSKKGYARVNYFAQEKEPKLLGFAGYKVGMTHIIESKKDKKTTRSISSPVTIIECPSLKPHYHSLSGTLPIYYNDVVQEKPSMQDTPHCLLLWWHQKSS